MKTYVPPIKGLLKNAKKVVTTRIESLHIQAIACLM